MNKSRGSLSLPAGSVRTCNGGAGGCRQASPGERCHRRLGRAPGAVRCRIWLFGRYAPSAGAPLAGLPFLHSLSSVHLLGRRLCTAALSHGTFSCRPRISGPCVRRIRAGRTPIAQGRTPTYLRTVSARGLHRSMRLADCHRSRGTNRLAAARLLCRSGCPHSGPLNGARRRRGRPCACRQQGKADADRREPRPRPSHIFLPPAITLPDC